MSKKRDDDGEMSSKRGDGGALGPDQGTPRKERAGDLGHDGGAQGPSDGMPRSAHAENGGGKHAHSNHMPGTKDSPNC